MPSQVLAIAAANTFCPAIPMNQDATFNISVWGIFVGTVTLQRSFDGGTTWLNVTNYSVPTEDQGHENETGVLYRLGIMTGNYTSGTANVRIGAQ